MNNDKKEALKTKVEKEYPEFVDSLQGSGKESLDQNLLIYAKYREEAELGKKEDEGLQEAQERARELAKPYNDAIKALKEKLAYINIRIEELKEVDGI